MADNYDQLALKWVREEVNKTLDQSRQALEAYAENPEDHTQIDFCSNCLHQVRGTLTMLEFYGAALFAEEMEALSEAIAQGKVKVPPRAQEVLMGAILQLPTYLERVQAGQRDLPVVLLPLLNDLRASRGETLLSESSIFTPNLAGVVQPAHTQPADMPHVDADWRDQAKKLRSHYQRGLLGVFRHQEVPESLNRLTKVAERLELITSAYPAGLLWWLATGFMEAIAGNEIHKNASVHALLGQIDKHLKQLGDEGEIVLQLPPSPELTKNLLYYVACTPQKSRRIAALREVYALHDALPSAPQLEAERNRMSGTDATAIRTVLQALNDDLVGVKEGLDLFVRSRAKNPADLLNLLPTLRQIGDTLGMLGLGAPRDAIRQQVQALQRLVDSGVAPNDGHVMDIAGALLFVEANLSSVAQNAAQMASEETEMDVAASSDSEEEIAATAQFNQAYGTLLAECRGNLQKCKDSIIDFMASSWDHRLIETIPALLTEVTGGLHIIGLPAAAEMVSVCQQFLSQRVLGVGSVPDTGQLDALADILTSVEYFLESLQEAGGHGMESVLSAAAEPTEVLRSELGKPLPAAAVRAEPVVRTPVRVQETESEAELADEPAFTPSAASTAAPAAPKPASAPTPSPAVVPATPAPVVVAPAPVVTAAPAVASAHSVTDSDLIDDEVIEIFIEEAGEQVDTIMALLPEWYANPEDEDALITIRRAFHTLKGSGRLVGAKLLGEMAWAIESMLNRVLDNTIVLSPAVQDIVKEAAEVTVPHLRESFASRTEPTIRPEPLMARAEALARGESVEAEIVTAATADVIPAPMLESTSVLTPEKPVAIDAFAETEEDHIIGSEEEADEPVVELATSAFAAVEDFESAAASEAVDVAAEMPEAEFSIVEEATPEPVYEAVEVAAEMPEAEFVVVEEAASEPVYETADVAAEMPEAEFAVVEEAASEPVYEAVDVAAEMPEAEFAVFEEPTPELATESVEFAVEEHFEPMLVESDYAENQVEEPAPLLVMDAAAYNAAEEFFAAETAAEERVAGEFMLHDDDVPTLGTESTEVATETSFAVADHAESISYSGEELIPELVMESAAVADADEYATTEFQVPEEASEWLPEATSEDLASFGEPYAEDTEAAATDDSEHAIAAEAHIASTETAPVEEMDSAVLEIFVGEAGAHLDDIDQYLADVAESPFSPKITDGLIRALHTLKGSARMTGLQAIADVMLPLEKHARDLQQRDLAVPAEYIAVLTDMYGMLRLGLGQMEQGLPIDRAAFEQLAQRADVLAEHEHVEATSGRDPEVLQMFLNEAMDVLSDADLALRGWKLEPEDSTASAQLTDLMTMLQDLATAAQVDVVAQLSGAVAQFFARGAALDSATADGLTVNEAFFALGTQAHDLILDMLDQIAADQTPQLPADFLNAMSLWPTSASVDVEEASAAPVLLSSESDALVVAADEYAAEAETPEFAEPVFHEAAEPLLSGSGETLGHANRDEPELAALATEEALFEEPVVLADSTSFVAETVNEMTEIDEPEHELVVPEPLAQEPASPFELVDVDAEQGLMPVIATEESVPLTEDIFGGEFEAEHAAFEEVVEPVAVDEVVIAEAEQVSSPEPEERFGDDDADEEFAEELVDDNEPAEALIDDDALIDDEEDETETIAPMRRAPEPAERVASSFDFETDTREAYVPLPINLSAYADNDVPVAFTVDEDGEEILQIFLEEAADILDAVDGALEGWAAAPEDKASVALLQRHLHTLKGGARLNDLTVLGDLAHEFENLFEALHEGRVRANAVLMRVANEGRDRLEELVNEVREKRTQTKPSLYWERLRAALAGEDPYAEMLAEQTGQAAPAAAVAPAPAVVSPAMPSAIVTKTASEMAPVISGWQPRSQPLPQQLTPQQQAVEAKQAAQVEFIRVPANHLENLVNLAGEGAIFRGRLEQQVTVLRHNLQEMEMTVARLREQLRQLEMETEAQVSYRKEALGTEYDEFDPLEFDRYTRQQELSRALSESAGDLLNLKESLDNLAADAETLLLQQGRINSELHDNLIRARMVPFSSLVPRLKRMVRQIGDELGKSVELSIFAEGEMDRTVLERMVAPIEHMLRNAIDHGIERPDKRIAAGKNGGGRIRIRLIREGNEVVIEIQDDGAGVNTDAIRRKAIERGLISEQSKLSEHELMMMILEAGFSTAEQVTQISGRGVGMDVVASEIKTLGGRIDIDSERGRGSRFTVRLPFTVSVNQALMVAVGEDVYSIPLANIEGIVRVSPYELQTYYENDSLRYEYAGQQYKMRFLGTLLEHMRKPRFEGVYKPIPVLLLHGTDQPVALHVDDLLGSREVVVKTVGSLLATISGLSGATILGDGRVVLILDLPALLRRADATIQVEAEVTTTIDKAPLVLVVDDSITVRKVTARLLERSGYRVETAKDGVDAVNVLHDIKPDIMLLDIEMPRMDGFELANIVRHDERLKDVPIIMITSRTGDKHRARAEEIGVNRYLGKPFNDVELLNTMTALLDEKK